MSRILVVAVLALTGLFCAAGIGVAAYLVSRDSVAVPVTRLQPKPSGSLAPATRKQTAATTRAVPTTTVDDHGGGDNSGHGGGGHGGDD